MIMIIITKQLQQNDKYSDKLVTLTILAIAPWLRKSRHLIPEFHWSVKICKKLETKLRHNLQKICTHFNI